jgi:hypothetical protein
VDLEKCRHDLKDFLERVLLPVFETCQMERRQREKAVSMPNFISRKREEKKTVATDIREIKQALLDPKGGLPTGKKSLMGVEVDKAFSGFSFSVSAHKKKTGGELVSWLIDRKYAKSKKEAKAVGNALLKMVFDTYFFLTCRHRA